MTSETTSSDPSNKGTTTADSPAETSTLPTLTLNDGNVIPMVRLLLLPLLLLIRHRFTHS